MDLHSLCFPHSDPQMYAELQLDNALAQLHNTAHSLFEVKEQFARYYLAINDVYG